MPSAWRASSSSVRSPGRLTAMPSAIVSTAPAATGSPRRSDSGYGAHAATCTPITSTSGRADLTAIATPEHSPPPPTGTTTRARSGHVLEQLEPERALAGDDVRVVERVHEREAAVVRALARERDAVVDRAAADVDDRALAARRLDLGDRRVARARRPRTGTPRARAAAARLCAWLPAEAATTPARAAVLAERRELGRDAADLERAGALEVLGLQRRPRRRRARRSCATRAPACAARSPPRRAGPRRRRRR